MYKKASEGFFTFRLEFSNSRALSMRTVCFCAIYPHQLQPYLPVSQNPSFHFGPVGAEFQQQLSLGRRTKPGQGSKRYSETFYVNTLAAQVRRLRPREGDAPRSWDNLGEPSTVIPSPPGSGQLTFSAWTCRGSQGRSFLLPPQRAGRGWLCTFHLAPPAQAMSAFIPSSPRLVPEP